MYAIVTGARPGLVSLGLSLSWEDPVDSRKYLWLSVYLCKSGQERDTMFGLLPWLKRMKKLLAHQWASGWGLRMG